jgi:hypothetical protein
VCSASFHYIPIVRPLAIVASQNYLAAMPIAVSSDPLRSGRRSQLFACLYLQ